MSYIQLHLVDLALLFLSFRLDNNLRVQLAILAPNLRLLLVPELIVVRLLIKLPFFLVAQQIPFLSHQLHNLAKLLIWIFFHYLLLYCQHVEQIPSQRLLRRAPLTYTPRWLLALHWLLSLLLDVNATRLKILPFLCKHLGDFESIVTY